MQVVKNHCHEVGAKLDDISLEVEFLKDEITLDFPEGMSKAGWEITPRSRPVVSTLVMHLLNQRRQCAIFFNLLYRLLKGK